MMVRQSHQRSAQTCVALTESRGVQMGNHARRKATPHGRLLLRGASSPGGANSETHGIDRMGAKRLCDLLR